MTNTKSTKRALLSSVLALLLCVSMLVGTTFAWFTDSVTSGKNTIVAGNLDIELYNGLDNTADSVQGKTDLFSEVTLWEPGVVAFENFTIENKGNLALKYQMTVNFTDIGTLNGHSLSEALQVAVVAGGIDAATATDRDAVIAKAANLEALGSFIKVGKMITKDTTETFAIVIYWEPTANDNIFNAKNGATVKGADALSIELGINLVATQLTSESDSIDNTYDAGAELPDITGENVVTISNVDELRAFAADVNGGNTYAGKTVYLTSDIDLAAATTYSARGTSTGNWTPIGPNADAANKFRGTFDGLGHTIENMVVVNTTGEYTASGFFGALNGTVKNLNFKNATVNALSAGDPTDNGIAVVAGSVYTTGKIQKVTVDGATVNGNRYVGGISGYTYGSVVNCTVKNASIVGTPDDLTGSYNNGDKVGGIIGYFQSESVYVASGNTVENVTLVAYRDVGGIIGSGNANSVVNNTASDVNIVIDRSKFYEDKDENAGAIVGRVMSGTVDASNTSENCTTITGTAAFDNDALNAAIQDGASTVVLGNDVEATSPITLNGSTLNGGGNTLDSDYEGTSGWGQYAIVANSGTVENITVVDAFRGVGSTNTTDDVYIKNVTIDNVTYAINGNGTGTQNVYVSDSTIYGWNSYADVASINFTDCTLGKGNSYDGYMVIYGTTNYTNCVFEDGYSMCGDLRGNLGATVTFTDCTYNGAKVTADNFKTLFGEEGDETDFNKLSSYKIVIDGVTVTW